MIALAALMLALAGTGVSAVDAEPTAAETLFQGAWDYRSLASDQSLGTLRVEGREFVADVIHGTYTGSVTTRPETSPPQVDFTIACECMFDGKTAAAIYREEDGTIVFATRAPGEPRPTSFADLEPETHEIIRLRRLDPEAVGDGE